MKKKVYQHPMMHSVMIQQAQLLSGSGDGKAKVTGITTKGTDDDGFKWGGGGSGPAVAPEYEDLEEEENW